MRDISECEVLLVEGAGIAADVGKWVGEKIGELQNTITEYVYNEPFRQQYG